MSLCLTLGELAHHLNAQLQGPADMALAGICSLEEPRPGHLGFAENPRQWRGLTSSQLGAVIVSPGATPGLPHLIHPKPRVAFAQTLQLFFPAAPLRHGVHPTSAVADDAKVSPQAEVGPFCVIGAGSSVESGCRLMARVVVGENSTVGADCEVFPGVVIGDGVVVGARSVLDAHCRLLDGAKLGADVYIGARSVLRGCHLGAGSKLDNMCYIGEESRLGPHSLMVAKAHVGRGVVAGPYFLLAAISTVVDGVSLLGPLTQVAGMSFVDRSWDEPKLQLAGEPAREMKQELKERSLRSRAYKIYQARRKTSDTNGGTEN